MLLFCFFFFKQKTAYEIDGRFFDEVRSNWFPWTMPFNMTGHPAVSMPCRFGGDGLPIGLQLVGRFHGDAELLRVCALFEAAQNALDRWPDPMLPSPTA